MNKIALSAVVLIWATLSSQAQNLSPDELARRATERRAVDAVIWGMPAVNYDLMLQEMLTKTPGKVNQVIYWGRPLDSKNQTLTPNPDTLYFMTFLNTKDVGPIVIDVPPAGEDGSLNANSSGRSRSKMRVGSEWTRARGSSSWCCRPDMRTRSPTATSCCGRTRTEATR